MHYAKNRNILSFLEAKLDNLKNLKLAVFFQFLTLSSPLKVIRGPEHKQNIAHSHA